MANLKIQNLSLARLMVVTIVDPWLSFENLLINVFI